MFLLKKIIIFCLFLFLAKTPTGLTIHMEQISHMDLAGNQPTANLQTLKQIKNSTNFKKIQFIIEKIPSQDKESLNNLFRYLITFESIGYVLYGDKPMVWDSFFSGNFYLTLKKARIFNFNRSWEDYLVWKKYQHFFSIENFIFRVFPSSYDSKYMSYLFINKKNVIKKIKTHFKVFKQKLGEAITPEIILSRLETKDKIIEEVFEGHEDLLGILLGFGVHNSLMYQKRENLDRSEKGRAPFDFAKIKKINQINLTYFDSEEEDGLFNFINLPCYVEDKDHAETVELRQKYKRLQKLLSAIYSEGSFLELTLHALTTDK